jgi:hypothetical protein
MTSRTRRFLLLAWILGLGYAPALLAVTCTSITAGGNWGTAGNWSCTAGGAHVPLAGEDVIVNTNFTVNVATNTVATVTVNGGFTLTQSSTLTTSGALSVSGILNSTNTMTIGGATSISGTLSINNTAGTRTFTGNVAVNNGGTLTTTVNEAMTYGGDVIINTGGTLSEFNGGAAVGIAGNFQNDGSYTASTGAHTFSGAAKTISGANAISIPSVTVTGTYTNQNTLTVSTALAGGGTLTNGDVTHASAVLNIGDAAVAAGLTLTASATGNTVNYNSAGAQTVKLPSGGNHFHLTVSGGNTKTPSAGTYNIGGVFTIGTGVTFNANNNDPTINVAGAMVVTGTYNSSNTAALAVVGTLSITGTYTGNNGALNLSGDFSQGGTFTSGTGICTFDSTTAVQNISGTPTFTNLTINNTGGGITLGGNVTASTTLILTAGIVNAGANTVIVGTAGTVTVAAPPPAVTSYVNGCVRKNYAASTPTFTFPIGDATAYTPVLQTFTSATVVSDLTACTSTPDHPQVATPIASTGIDAAKSANRWWTLTPNLGGTGTPSGTYSVTFNFVAADVDGAANTANFIIERYDGTNWNPAPIGARTATSTQATSLTLYGDFAVGEALTGFNAALGAFNIFEVSTPANSALGRIYTNIVGSAVTLQVVAVNATRTGVNAAFNTNPITVDVLDARDNSGALTAATNCRPTWFPPGGPAVIFSQSLSPTWTNGRTSTVTVFTAAANTIARREVRIRVTQGANIGCSNDNFSIRPTSFSITSTNATNVTTGGTPSFKTGASFNLTATAVSGYDGTPTIDNTKIVGTPNPGTIGGSFAAAPIATGVASGAAFTYGEVGNFGLNADAVFDSSFTSVDLSGDCNTGTSNVPAGGKYGCSIGSTAVAAGSGLGFGRFFPDHYFVAAAPTPGLVNRTASACSPASAFTYMKEGMALTFTLQARNSAATVTQNYAGAYATLTAAQIGLGAVSGATNLTSRASAIGSFNFIAGQASVTTPATVNTTTITAQIDRASSPDGPYTNTKIGIAPTDGDGATVRSVDTNMDVDGVGGNDHVQIGAATELRFGRLRIQSALGSEKLDLPVPLQAEYWAGTGFAVNGSDNCTLLTQKNFVLSNWQGGLSSTNMVTPTAGSNGNIGTVSAFVNGLASVTLLKPSPTPASPGSVDLCLDLDVTAPGTDATCQAVTPADKTYLQLLRTNPPNTYTQDPFGRAAFGLYGSQPNNFIFFRENF